MRDLRLLREFGRRLKKLRQQLGVKQKTLADAAGINVSHLSALENGRQSPTLETLYALAKALKITVGELLPEPSSQTPAMIANQKWLSEHGKMTLDEVISELRAKL